MGGRRGSAVDIVVVAPGTSSSVGSVMGNRDVEGRRCSLFVFKKSRRRWGEFYVVVHVRSWVHLLHLLVLLVLWRWCYCCCCCYYCWSCLVFLFFFFPIFGTEASPVNNVYNEARHLAKATQSKQTVCGAQTDAIVVHGLRCSTRYSTPSRSATVPTVDNSWLFSP